MHSCYILGLAKLVQTHWVFKIVYQLPAETVITEDLNTFSGLPVTCHLLCTADNFLMSVAMFYVATLAIYLFCRPPHPDYPEHLKKVNRIKSQGCLLRSPTFFWLNWIFEFIIICRKNKPMLYKLIDPPLMESCNRIFKVHFLYINPWGCHIK